MRALEISSVFLYLFIYCTSTVFFYIFTNDYNKKISITFGGVSVSNHAVLAHTMGIIATIIPCLLAAFRDPAIGIDPKIYVIPNYNYALNKGVMLNDCLHHFPIKVEFLFTLLVFVCAKLNSLTLLFFLIQLLVFIPMIMAVKIKKLPLALTMLLFFFLFYNLTFGLMRQAVAASFLLLAYAYLEEKKYKSVAICIAIAFLFHSSSIFMIAIYFVIQRVNKSNRRFLYFSLILTMMIFVILSGKGVSVFLQRIIRPISNQYAGYLSYQLTGKVNADNVSWSNIMIYTILIIYSTYKLLKTDKLDYEAQNLLFISILGVLMRIWSIKFLLAVRFAHYFDVFLLMYIPKAYKAIEFKKSRFFEKAIIISLCAIFWFFFYIYKNNLNTAIYKFRG